MLRRKSNRRQPQRQPSGSVSPRLAGLLKPAELDPDDDEL